MWIQSTKHLCLSGVFVSHEIALKNLRACPNYQLRWKWSRSYKIQYWNQQKSRNFAVICFSKKKVEYINITLSAVIKKL